MERNQDDRPATGEQVFVTVLLVLLDLLVMAWLLYGYAITGWADAYDTGNPPDAPGMAKRSAWILAGAAVVTGGGLSWLRWRIPGTTQLWLLGFGAAAFGLLALS